MLEATSRVLKPNDLFGLAFVHDARFSPDGLKVTYVTSRAVEESSEELFEIRILELDGRGLSRVEFDGRAMHPRWSPDGSRLAFIGAKDNTQQLFIADHNGRFCTAVSPASQTVQGAPSWSADSLQVAYTVASCQASDGNQRITRRQFRSEGVGIIDRFTMSIHIADVRRFDSRAIDAGRATAIQPMFSPCGRRMLFLGSYSTAAAYATEAFVGGLRLFVIDIAEGKVEDISGDGWSISAATWSPCGEYIIVAGDRDSKLTFPTMGLWVIRADGSRVAECRTDGFVGNVGLRMHHDMPTWNGSPSTAVHVSPSGHAYVTVTARGRAEIWKIALNGAMSCEPIVSGARACLFLDGNVRRRKILYCVSDLNKPWDLFSLDMESGQETQLTALNERVLSSWPVMTIKHLTFSSADGTAIEGWHLAREDRPGPQPTVMFIHGGPYIATGHIFRFDFHLLAANGYAVLFANFRGSTGYGDAFVQSMVGDWGNRGFADHMAAIDASIAEGLTNADRLGVWGPSHGGFATAWIVCHTDRFKAAIVESATTNWVTKYYLADTTGWIVKELGGKPHEIPDVYRARSPITYAWRCSTPTLMLHGDEDTRCPVTEAEQFYRALHDAGCATELVRVRGMNHMGDSIGPLPVRRAQNEAVLEWFERHL